MYFHVQLLISRICVLYSFTLYNYFIVLFIIAFILIQPLAARTTINSCVYNADTVYNQSANEFDYIAQNIFITYTSKSRGSKAFILVCLCVCPHERTKAAAVSEITKLATEIVHHVFWIPI